MRLEDVVGKIESSEGWRVQYTNGHENVTERHIMTPTRIREYVLSTLAENPGFSAKIIQESTEAELDINH